jgi:hypothetical protein
MAPVVVNRNLHSDDSDRYCMHIELDISESRYFKFISFCLNSQFFLHQVHLFTWRFYDLCAVICKPLHWWLMLIELYIYL